ncbi:MAG: ABC transporter permease [Gemmatimonadaceae bacterium]|nr:ABC transporter permease [Gemmatimonadaceae bacterium]
MVDDAGRLWRRLRVWLRWRRHSAELKEELAHHLELKRRALEAQGLSPSDADAAAHRAMGNVTVMREVSRNVWLTGWMESVWQDLRYGARSLRRQPVFAAVAILGLTGGLGFSAAAFSGFNAFALRGWSVREPERLVALYAISPGTKYDRFSAGFSLDQIAMFESRARSLDGLIAYDRTRPDGTGSVTAAPVRAGYFTVLGIPMARGREFTPDEDRVGSPQSVIVLSHHYWRTTLSSSPDVLGSTVRVKGVPFTVIGVAAAGFDGTDLVGVDGWIPLTAMTIVRPRDRRSKTALTHTDQCCVSVGARLAPGVSREAARSELTALLAQTRRPGIDTVDRTALVQSFTAVGSSGPNVSREVLPVFLLIGGGVGVVMLLACANVANLLLARAASREREIRIRLALGASRGRLIRQLMTESLLLALLAGLPALAIARVVPPWVMRTLTTESAILGFSTDANTLMFTLGLAVLSCLLFGLAPALHATRPATVQRQQLPLRSVFLSAQVVFCLVLLVSAGLFLRQIRAQQTTNLGFAVADVTEVTVSVPGNEDEAGRSERLSTELPELVTGLRLTQVAFSEYSPLQNAVRRVWVPGRTDRQTMPVVNATPEYFRVLGIPLLAGRPFAAGASGRTEVVINRLLAEQLGGPNQALGVTLLVDSVPRTVVGIVPTIRDVGLGDPQTAIYQSFQWQTSPRVIVRGDVTGAQRLVKAIMARDPSLGASLRSYTWYVDQALSTSVFAATVAGAIGVLALLLASVGMFGVFSYWVRQRQHDIGVRMALGATPARVVRMVLRASARAVGFGLVIGVVAAAGAAQLLRSSLYGLSPLDPVTFATAIGILAGTALVATLLPAWRAVHVDPLESLRAD